MVKGCVGLPKKTQVRNAWEGIIRGFKINTEGSAKRTSWENALMRGTKGTSFRLGSENQKATKENLERCELDSVKRMTKEREPCKSPE